MKKNILNILLLLLVSCNHSTSPTPDSNPGIVEITPNPAPTQTPIPIPNPDTGPDTVNDFKLNCEESRFVSLLNIYRSNNHLPLVAVSKSGVESTRWHAQDMIDKNYFSHTEPNGRTFSNRAASFGYPAWSENIAAGNISASTTFCQWKNSAGHNTNMLSERHRSIGIGNAVGGGTYRAYWGNNFGPAETDLLVEPLSNEPGCVLPVALPGC